MRTEVQIGRQYKHHKGVIYTPIMVTNTVSSNPTFPTTVVYIGPNGLVWSRPLEDWTPDKFTLVENTLQ